METTRQWMKYAVVLAIVLLVIWFLGTRNINKVEFLWEPILIVTLILASVYFFLRFITWIKNKIPEPYVPPPICKDKFDEDEFFNYYGFQAGKEKNPGERKIHVAQIQLNLKQAARHMISSSKESKEEFSHHQNQLRRYRELAIAGGYRKEVGIKGK